MLKTIHTLLVPIAEDDLPFQQADELVIKWLFRLCPYLYVAWLIAWLWFGF